MSYVKLIVSPTDGDYSVKVKYDSVDNMRHYKVRCPLSDLSRLNRNIINTYLPTELRMVSNTLVKVEIRSYCTEEMVEIYNQVVRNFAPQIEDRHRDGLQYSNNPFNITPNFSKPAESNNSLFAANGMPAGRVDISPKTSSLVFNNLSHQAAAVLEEVKAYAICHGKHPNFTLTTEKNKLRIRNYISSVYGKPVSYEVLDEVAEALRQQYLWK